MSKKSSFMLTPPDSFAIVENNAVNSNPSSCAGEDDGMFYSSALLSHRRL
jgi:hypothetical protein